MNWKPKYLARSSNLYRLILLVFCALFISTTLACGDEPGGKKDDISDVDTATLTVDPGAINFDLVNIGETDQRTLTISNTGNGILRIRNIELIKSKPDNSNLFNQIGDWKPRDLKPNEQFVLTVEYAPLEEKPDAGIIRITSNDLTRGKLDIPIRTAQRQPQIFTPRIISFERVGPGTPESRVVMVQNIGRAALNIQNILQSGHQAFSMAFPDPTAPTDTEKDTDQWPTVVEPGEAFPLRVTFSPDDTEPAKAEIVFYSNDANEPQYTVELLGNSGAPCISVTDEDGINFGPSYISRTSRRAITITNCSGGSDLIVSSIELANDADAKFKVPSELLPAELPDGPLTIRPRESANFTLTYDPTEVVVDTGELMIRSDDPSKMLLKIPVTGEGSLTNCPTAVAEARIKGETQQYTQELNARPLQHIELSALQSSGDGALTYEWALLSRPAGSQTRILPSTTITEPELWLDLAGDYEIELVVYDPEGLASCEPSIVKIHVVPGAAIHVQLTWYAKAVPNPEKDNRGTDLDLHYRHPLGNAWNDAFYDIYWKNRAQNWGTASSPSMATIDIDDQWGVTTENINHKNPIAGMTYKVGVHYFIDNGYGDAEATVRIYIEGQLKAEFRDKPMKHKYFWEIAGIQWPTGNILTIDKIGCDGTFPGFGNNTCR